MRSLFKTRRSIMAATIAFTAFALPQVSAAAEVTVFAAASLKTALDDVTATWAKDTGNSVVISYAASSQLAQQIQAGAPAGLFISAAENWMDKLQEGGLIVPESRKDILGNTLILVAHRAGAAPVDITKGFDLAGMLGDEKLAMALVDSVPAGVYGKEALTSLGIWAAVEPKVAQSDNVRSALALVATGEAPMGIVYASDAVAETGVAVVGTFPEDSHKPITYPAAVVTENATPEAAALLEYLSSDAADAVFTAQGFQVLN